MLLNYFKIAFRRLFATGRSPMYAWINISGLTIGLTAVLLIGHYIHYQLSYDRFFPNHENIYRLAVERQESGEVTLESAKTYAGIGSILMNEVLEVEQFVRILDEECTFRYKPKDITVNRQRTFWADGNFSQLFELKLLTTGQTELLHEPNQAIISRSAAERIFGTDWSGELSPIGKTVFLNEHIPFMIQGVFEDLPAHSHMQVDVVVSYTTLMALLGDYMNTVMPPGGNFVYTYVALRSGTEKHQLEPVLNEVISSHSGAMEDQVNYRFTLQPITSIHLNSHLSHELNPNGNRLFVLALMLAAILILVVAWINFINLAIARAMNRAREVGVRKAIGARKSQLAVQFTIEILLSGLVSLLFTVLLSLALSSYFNELTNITLPLFSRDQLMLWLVLMGTFLAGVALASVYPAFVLSSFNPLKALKGKNVISPGNTWFRQGLLTFQFCIALLLLSCTGAIYYQVNAMRQQSLGAKLDQVVVLHTPRSMIGNPERALQFERFRDILEENPEIISVASGGCLPGEKFLYHTENVQAEGKSTAVSWSFDMASVDEQYLPTLGFNIISGRNFEPRQNEEDKVILNKTAILALGFQDPDEAVGRFIRIDQDHKKQIIGVIADVHFEGLQQTIKPLLLKYGHDYEFGFFPVKIAAGQYDQALKKLISQWNVSYPKDPIDYFFLDKFFDRQYQNDQAFGQLFGSFSLLTIFISGLGLFGLIAFTTYQRSREIAIRKVLGADIRTIFTMLTAGFLKLIVLAAIITLPLAHLFIDQWLDTFAYRFHPGWLLYLIPVVVLVITSLISVGGHTLRAALSNPVEAIADE